MRQQAAAQTDRERERAAELVLASELLRVAPILSRALLSRGAAPNRMLTRQADSRGKGLGRLFVKVYQEVVVQGWSLAVSVVKQNPDTLDRPIISGQLLSEDGKIVFFSCHTDMQSLTKIPDRIVLTGSRAPARLDLSEIDAVPIWEPLPSRWPLQEIESRLAELAGIHGIDPNLFSP
jgi:hypothetical protein